MPDATGRDALVRAGRQLYLDGQRADGSAYPGRRADGTRVEGAAAACVNCHRRSAQGGLEGQVLIPPVTGATLFQDGVYAPQGGAPPDPHAALLPRYQSRRAYTLASLARALREGVDSDGRVLADPMPRYAFEDGEIAALAAWLDSRSAGDGGIGQEGPRFWVVVTGHADAQRAAAVQAVVAAFAGDVLAPARPWQLRWFDLRTDPQALERALVDGSPRPLALLSGAAGDDWAAVAGLCEREELPCLLPSLLDPPAQSTRHYSQYFSDGLSAEAAAIAAALDQDPRTACRPALVVAVAGGDVASATGLEQLLGALPQAHVITPGEALQAPPACAVAWLPQPALEALLAAIRPTDEARWWLPGSLQSLRGPAAPADWKTHLRIATTLDPEAPLRAGTVLAPWLQRHRLAGLDERAAADALAACALTEAALGELEGERIRGMRHGAANRDELVEALEHVARGLRLPLVVHYRGLAIGGVGRTLSHGVRWLAWPSPQAPVARPLSAP